MNDLRTAAQQALEALEMSRRFVYADNRPQCDDAIATLRVTLKQEAEAAAWLAERKEHWRKEREKAQAAKDQDPELSAALGWPGGISNPVLDRVQLLQMVAALRVSAQQALETLELEMDTRRCKVTIAALRAALAQQDQQAPESTYHPCTFILIKGLKKLKAWDVLAEWDKVREIVDKRLRAAPPQQVKLDDPERRCGGPGCDMTCCQPLAQQAEPVEPVAWMCSNPELMAKGYERFASRCEGDWNIPVYTSPPQRQPLTDEVAALTAQRDALLEALKDIAGTDPVDAALDPQRAVRIARAAIKAVEGTK